MTPQLCIGSAVLGRVPRVVLSVWKDEHVPSPGVSILEARIDLFGTQDPAEIKARLERFRAHGLPLLGTPRSAAEGGGWQGSEEARRALLVECLPLLDAADIELDADPAFAVAACRKFGKTLILSHHDFSRTPDDEYLEAVLGRARNFGADLVKLACQARTREEAARLMAFQARHAGEALVCIAMGEHGVESRLAAQPLTYTSPEPAYGQIPLPELLQRLRDRYPAFTVEFPVS